jgi:hypothetical protein
MMKEQLFVEERKPAGVDGIWDKIDCRSEPTAADKTIPHAAVFEAPGHKGRNHG